jgi:hypothetical protein
MNGVDGGDPPAMEIGPPIVRIVVGGIPDAREEIELQMVVSIDQPGHCQLTAAFQHELIVLWMQIGFHIADGPVQNTQVGVV